MTKFVEYLYIAKESCPAMTLHKVTQSRPKYELNQNFESWANQTSVKIASVPDPVFCQPNEHVVLFQASWTSRQL